MKMTLYDLLGLIKEDKAPKKIKLNKQVFVFDEQHKDYQCSENDDYIWDEYLFEDYCWKENLNEEVEILEVTLYPENVSTQDTKIEKLNMLDETNFFDYRLVLNQTRGKINEIIERINNL